MQGSVAGGFAGDEEWIEIETKEGKERERGNDLKGSRCVGRK